MHIRTHMTVTCKHCGKKILYNSRTSHMKQCIGEKTYNCENCPALFKREDHLKVHVNKRSCSIQCNLWAHIYGFSPVCFHSVSSKRYNQSKHHCKHCMWNLMSLQIATEKYLYFHWGVISMISSLMIPQPKPKRWNIFTHSTPEAFNVSLKVSYMRIFKSTLVTFINHQRFFELSKGLVTEVNGSDS